MSPLNITQLFGMFKIPKKGHLPTPDGVTLKRNTCPILSHPVSQSVPSDGNSSEAWALADSNFLQIAELLSRKTWRNMGVAYPWISLSCDMHMLWTQKHMFGTLYRNNARGGLEWLGI